MVFAVGAYEVLQGRLTSGQVVSTAALAGMIFGPVARLADLAYVFEQTAASVDRLGEILDLEPDVREPAPADILNPGGPEGKVRGQVDFNHVGFGYRMHEPVVWDIRLSIKPGMKVALVGPTGCGKSTLVNLLMRFYDPLGARFASTTCRSAHSHAASATPDRGRAPGPGRLSPQPGREHPLRQPRGDRPGSRDGGPRGAVHDFAMRLPQGYDTLVGEGGFKLSQGERQRLAIARALCTTPPLWCSTRPPARSTPPARP